MLDKITRKIDDIDAIAVTYGPGLIGSFGFLIRLPFLICWFSKIADPPFESYVNV